MENRTIQGTRLPAGPRVYFIQCQATKSIKIGTSTDPGKRLAQLQTGSAAKLWIVGTLPGDESREREIHEQFARYRTRGEWFDIPFGDVCHFLRENRFEPGRNRLNFHQNRPKGAAGFAISVDLDYIVSSACGFRVRVWGVEVTPQCVLQAAGKYGFEARDGIGIKEIREMIARGILSLATGCGCDKFCRVQDSYKVELVTVVPGGGRAFFASKAYQEHRLEYDEPVTAAAIFLSAWQEWLRMGGDPN